MMRQAAELAHRQLDERISSSRDMRDKLLSCIQDSLDGYVLFINNRVRVSNNNDNNYSINNSSNNNSKCIYTIKNPLKLARYA